MKHGPRFGIYINSSSMKAVRISSPYWIPDEPDWKYLTDDVNTTMVEIRRLAGESGMVKLPEKLMWGSIPPKDQ